MMDQEEEKKLMKWNKYDEKSQFIEKEKASQKLKKEKELRNLELMKYQNDQRQREQFLKQEEIKTNNEILNNVETEKIKKLENKKVN